MKNRGGVVMNGKTTKGRNKAIASRRGIAVFMSVCLLFTMSAVYGLAGDENDQLDAKASSAIVAFKDLKASISTQTVENGTGVDSLNLPDDITGTDSNGDSVAISGVKWKSEPAYDGSVAGEYIFKAVIPSGYDWDTEIPEIVVIVQDKPDEPKDDEPKVDDPTVGEPQTPDPATQEGAVIKAAGDTISAFATPKNIPLNITNFKVQRNGQDIGLPGSDVTFENGDSFSISLDWAVDYDSMSGEYYVNAGDYADFNLWTGVDEFPLQSSPMTATVFMPDPTNPNVNIDIGTLTLQADGSVHIVFNGNLAGLHNVNGKMSLITTIKYTTTTKPVEDITFYNENNPHTFVFKPSGTNIVNVWKYNGTRKDPTNTAVMGNLKWMFDVNPILSLITGNPVITDTMTSTNSSGSVNNKFIENTLAVYEVTINPITGDRTRIQPALTKDVDYNVSFNNNVMVINMLGTDPFYGRAYQVEYEAEPAAPTQGANSLYTNTVTFNGASNPGTFRWNTIMTNEKSGVYVADPEGKIPAYIQWTIKINQNNGVTPDEIVINDVFPSSPGYGDPTNFELYTTSGTYTSTTNRMINEKAAFVISGPTPSATGFTLTLFGNKMNSEGLRYGYVLKYQTPVNDSAKTTFENVANIAGTNVTGPAIKEAWKGIPGIFKESDGHDERTKTISWISTIYPGYSTLGPGIVLKDIFTITTSPAGFTTGINMDLTTIDMITLGSDELDYNSTGVFSGSKQYSYEKVAGGFNITFSNDVIVDKAYLQVHYTTTYTLPDYGESGYAFDDITFNNLMELYVGSTKIDESDDDVTLGGSEWQNGVKNGLLDPDTGIIDWEILVNSHMSDVQSDIVINDIFPVDKKAPGDSLSVGLVEYVNGTILLEKRDTPTGSWDPVAPGAFTLTNGDATKGFSLTISTPGTSEYRVTYKTKLIGLPNKLYENTANIPGLGNLVATVENKETGMLSKEAMLAATEGIVNWTVVLNSANTIIEKNVEIVDTLSLGHDIDRATIELKNSLTGAIVPEENYDIHLDVTSNPWNVLTIKIKDTYDFSVSHTLTYDTIINLDTIKWNTDHTNMVVSNSAILTGANRVYGEDEEDQLNKWSGLDVIGGGERVPIRIRKVSAESGEGLPGAEFIIQTLSGDPVSDEPFVTSGSGINGGYTNSIYLLAGEYVITEVKAPSGYVLAKETTQPAIITPTTEDDFAFVFENERAKISCEVDKDTIRRTSAAYVSLPGQEGINNVGIEQYRYDVDFRAMANVPATDFVLKDPLENVKYGQVKVDQIWNPVVWGDVDDDVEIWIGTNGSAPYPWKTISATSREPLYPPANLTHIEFRYGDVEVGFTSSLKKKYSLNGENREPGGPVELPPGTQNPGRIEPLSALQLANYNYMRAAIAMMDSNTISAFASGIGEDGGGDFVDWRPAADASAVNFSQTLLDKNGGVDGGLVYVAPATYLVSAVKPMQTEDIISSASSHIYLGGTVDAGGQLQAQDQDAVVTKQIVTFEANPDNVDINGLVMEDSFIENARAQGITFSGGRAYGANGQLLTTAKTGDKALLGLWMSLMAGALVIILLLTAINHSRKRKLSNTKGGAK